MLIQPAPTPRCSKDALSPTWLGCQTAEDIDSFLDRAMALAGAGAWSCNLSNDGLSWTSGVYDLFGIPLGAKLDRRDTVEMYTEESREAMEAHRAQAISDGGNFTLDAQIIRPDGEMRWMRISGEMIRHAGADPILQGLKQDVTEEKLRLETLRQLAENDALTGLASRTLYESRFLNKRRTASPMLPLGALVLFDLDGLKAINDDLGHLAGDACLREFATRMSASFPDALLIARIGGDEFAVILGKDQTAATIETSLTRFTDRLRAPLRWREHMLTIATTSGVAVPADPYSYDPEELFVRADVALYAAKRRRRSDQTSGRYEHVCAGRGR